MSHYERTKHKLNKEWTMVFSYDKIKLKYKSKELLTPKNPGN
jgi:hypothetical protein